VYQFDFHLLFDRQVSRLFVIENAADVDASQTISVSNARPVASLAWPSLASLVVRGHRMASRQRNELVALGGKNGSSRRRHWKIGSPCGQARATVRARVLRATNCYPSQNAEMASCSRCTVENLKAAAAASRSPNLVASAETLVP